MINMTDEQIATGLSTKDTATLKLRHVYGSLWVGYCNLWSVGAAFWCSPAELHPCQTRHIPRDNTLGSCCVQGPWPCPGKTGTRFFNYFAIDFFNFFSFMRVFINYLEGLTKWSCGPYTARRPEVPHPCFTQSYCTLKPPYKINIIAK